MPQGDASVTTSRFDVTSSAQNSLTSRWPCSSLSRPAIHTKLLAMRLACTSFPATLDLGFAVFGLGWPSSVASHDSAAHRGGTKPATKANDPAKDLNALAPITGFFRNSSQVVTNEETLSSGMETITLFSVLSISISAPIHLIRLPATDLGNLKGYTPWWLPTGIDLGHHLLRTVPSLCRPGPPLQEWRPTSSCP